MRWFRPSCPEITVVSNDDQTGIVTAPEPVPLKPEDDNDFFDVAADADNLSGSRGHRHPRSFLVRRNSSSF